MPVYVNIIIIAVLFYFNGIFAMYEIAMVSARKTRLQQRSDDGNRGANDALELLKDPNQQPEFSPPFPCLTACAAFGSSAARCWPPPSGPRIPPSP